MCVCPPNLGILFLCCIRPSGDILETVHQSEYRSKFTFQILQLTSHFTLLTNEIFL